MNTRSFWISGLAAGLLMIGGIGIAMIASIPYTPDGASAMGIGILLLCFSYFWMIVSAIAGVWLYQRSGNTVSIKEGLFIGGISGIFAITLAMIYGIVQLATQPESILKDISIAGISEFLVLIGGPVSSVLFTAGFGGFLGGILFQKKNNEIAAAPKISEVIINNPALDENANSANINQTTKMAVTNKSPITASLLSLFLLGGAGQIYLGQWKKGLALIIATIFGFFIFTIPIGASDAFNTAHKMKSGDPLGEWEFNLTGKTIGLAVIGLIGVIVIFNLLIFLGVLLIGYMQGTVNLPT